jgi:hydrogenase expression/formation protein HypD
MEQVFEPAPARWRGIGEVAGSGLKLKNKYKRFDAEANFTIEPGPTVEPAGCICGDILRGVKTPSDCPLFGRVCTPESPVGPCMVSTEGSCSACYLYGEGLGG